MYWTGLPQRASNAMLSKEGPMADMELLEPEMVESVPRIGAITFRDVGHTGPSTLAGRYLRQFWQPVFHSAEVAPGQSKAVRVMGQDFTLYRGASGAPYLVDSACPHRAMPLHAGWVEGETIRCFYHGWRFDGSGQCVEQPAERPSFCHKIRTGAYPTRDYLGLVFAYLGEGEAPAFPRYPTFEGDDVVLNHDTYERACHFFNNLENAGDKSHIAFAHRDASAAWDETVDGPTITAEESPWGITFRTIRPSGKQTVSQFGMPNIYHARGVPDDQEVAYREFLAWWVPVDDDRHIQFTIARHPANSPVTERYQQRRAARIARQDLDREAIARAILAGEMRLEDVDPSRVNVIFLQDDVAQMGVGPVATRGQERLGRGDVALILQRRLWVRELSRFATGEALTEWRYDADAVPVQAEY
jgi:5,5'-dehydrodivanillate O-demethylase oxygenase subunit